MKKTQIIVFQLLMSLFLFGQNNKDIDFNYNSFALKDSIDKNLTFEQTANKIKHYCSTDTQIICLVAGWIYDNIDFDLEKFYAGSIVNDYKTVFELRKGTCGDYSIIFSAFCDRFKIENEIIEGYVPEYDSENKIYYETNHVWNIVKIGHYWYHCDLLGFSGYLKKDSVNGFEFVKQQNTMSFLTQEVSFLSKHIPADPIWQLTNYPIPFDTLLEYGSYSEIDSSGKFLDYEKEINNYVKLSTQNKLLVFADNAYNYNINNNNVVAVNYYNASVDLINNWNGDKQKLILAKQYLEKAKKYVNGAVNGVEILKSEIETALAIIKKYES